MNNFDLKKPNSVGEAAHLKSETSKSRFIAGGTNLIDLIKYRIDNPESLIDLEDLGLASFEKLDNGEFRLGSMVTNADTAYHSTVEKKYPLLAKAILSGASAQLRNMATNGGNLLQRTRCYYFYDTSMPCNKRQPGSGCSALNGFNRMHAILGANKNCIATHPSDMSVALAALNARINVRGKDGSRTIPILDFHRLPDDNPEIDTNLKSDEIVISIDLPEQGFPEHYEYLKVRDRPSYAFALVSVAAAIEVEDNSIKDIRIALGGVSHKPWRDPSVEKKFIGKPIEAKTFNEISELLLENAEGYGHNDFKVNLAKKAIQRALQSASNQKQ